jgi:hypothetical protein
MPEAACGCQVHGRSVIPAQAVEKISAKFCNKRISAIFLPHHTGLKLP